MKRVTKNQNKITDSTLKTLAPLAGFHKIFNDALRDFYHMMDTNNDLGHLERRSLFPAMDIVESDAHYNIELEMPGMGEEDIQVSIDNNRLTVKGEKSTSKQHKDKSYLSREIQYGSYERSIDLPATADAEQATASFKKGMLWIKIPKKAIAKNNSRKIKIDKAK